MTLGARRRFACNAIGLSTRTLERWQKSPGGTDLRKGPKNHPRKFRKEEVDKVLSVANSVEFCDSPPCQIVPILSDRNEYVGSESSFYRILRRHNLLHHRHRSRKPRKAPAYTKIPTDVKKPNDAWTWDITLLNSPIRGQYYYLYMFEDVYSRKIVGWEVHDRQNDYLSSSLFKKICLKENTKVPARLHSDNGGPMRGWTMLATLQRLGVVPSFSRPCVKNDNPHIESLFKTMKYGSTFPKRPFESIEAARMWVENFTSWYNNRRRHSGLNYVTPQERHDGRDQAIQEKRTQLYERAQMMNPCRWTKSPRNWMSIKLPRLLTSSMCAA